MKHISRIDPQLALRNIESIMRAEGMQISEETKRICIEILLSGEEATKFADYYIIQAFKKSRKDVCDYF